MKRYKARPAGEFDLSKIDPGDQSVFEGDKKQGKTQLKELTRKLEELQELLYAEGRRKVLIVLQGMDTSGKDGTIRHVFDGVNPQGVSVANFKVPSAEELRHDYLWRVHKQVPGKGEIVIFNRSHYEDVLVVRVHSLVTEEIWRKRYKQINDFERILVEEGTTILKFFLHISLKEQKERLQARIDVAEKNWKFNPNDLKERKLWDQYIAAYNDALNRTSTRWAPWYIIPSDRKWYRNLVISTIIVNTLTKFNMKYPATAKDIKKYVIE
jgi:PPK2 family polyphosphate:nucleotide phosphotransferase